MRHAKLLADLAQIARRSLLYCMMDSAAEITFRSAILARSRQDFILDAVGKVSIRFVFAQVFKRQDGDRFTFDGNCEWRLFRGFDGLLRM